MIKSWFWQIPLEVLFICQFENPTDKSFHLLCLQQQLWWELALKTHPLISLTSSPNSVYTSHECCKNIYGWKASITQQKINIFGLKLHIFLYMHHYEKNYRIWSSFSLISSLIMKNLVNTLNADLNY